MSRRAIELAAAAVLAGVLLLILARPTAMDVFFPVRGGSPQAPAGGASMDPAVRGVFAPDAVISIRVDVESPAGTAIDVTPPPPPPAREESEEEPAAEEPAGSGAPPPDLDVDELLDQAAAPRQATAPGSDTVPPRPVEITWPETRRLKHCIGRSVEVRILVGEDGGVQQVEPAGEAIAADCLAAAVEAARRIRFEPGRLGGRASAMWTQVRIDFERKK